jgi:hypothetical protein
VPPSAFERKKRKGNFWEKFPFLSGGRLGRSGGRLGAMLGGVGAVSGDLGMLGAET